MSLASALTAPTPTAPAATLRPGLTAIVGCGALRCGIGRPGTRRLDAGRRTHSVAAWQWFVVEVGARGSPRPGGTAGMRRPLAVLRRAVAGSLDFALGTAPSASTPTAAPAPPARGRFVVGAVSFSRRLEAAVPLAADRLLGLATLAVAGLPAGIPVRIVEGVEVFTRSRPGHGSLLVIEAARQRPIASLFAATAAAPATPAAPAAPAASFVDIIART